MTFELQDTEDAQVRLCFACVVALLKHVLPCGMALPQRGLTAWWSYSFASCFLRPFLVLQIRVLPCQCLVKEVTANKLEKVAQTFSASICAALNAVHLSPTLVTQLSAEKGRLLSIQSKLRQPRDRSELKSAPPEGPELFPQG